MAFRMTSDISIGAYKAVKASDIAWRVSVASFTDTCTIKLPLATSIKKTVEGTDIPRNNVQTVFAVGDKVRVACGYNGDNQLRFLGYVARINYAVPLVLECEGYSYQLKHKTFTRSYKSTTLVQLLTDLTDGTEILLSSYIPDVTIENVTFNNVASLKVLEWLQKELLCTVYFNEDSLYAGPSKYAVPKPTERLRLGWNTIDDKDLKLASEDTDLEINIVAKDATGTVKRTKSEQSKYGSVKDVKIRAGMPDDFMKTLRKELQDAQSYAGYEGAITLFLDPWFEKGMVADITDMRFPARTGKYFVETIDGKFGKSGGRQTLKLKHYGNE